MRRLFPERRETLRLTLGLGIQSGDLLEESQQDMSIPEPSLSGEEDQAPSDWSSMVLVLSAVVLVNSAFCSRHSLNSHKTLRDSMSGQKTQNPVMRFVVADNSPDLYTLA